MPRLSPEQGERPGYKEFLELLESHKSDCERLDRKLDHYEAKHQMSSDTFYRNYRTGVLEDISDFKDWADACRMYVYLKKG